jgi:hypothetical protein
LLWDCAGSIDTIIVDRLLNVFDSGLDDDSHYVRATLSKGHIYAARNLIESVSEVTSECPLSTPCKRNWRSTEVRSFLRVRVVCLLLMLAAKRCITPSDLSIVSLVAIDKSLWNATKYFPWKSPINSLSNEFMSGLLRFGITRLVSQFANRNEFTDMMIGWRIGFFDR